MQLLASRPPRALHVLLIVSLAFLIASCGARAQRKAAATRPAKGSPTTTQPLAANPAPGAVADARPLYERLGGTAGVTKVVDDFVALAAADPKVNFTRKGQPNAWEATPEQVATLKKRLVEFISTATGGDVPYHGGDMVSVHRGMNITDPEFDALAADLQAALKKNSVPAREQAELLAVVNRTRSAIVATPASAKAAETKTPAAPAAVAERPAPFVPQPVTSDETELEEEPATKAPDQLNK